MKHKPDGIKVISYGKSKRIKTAEVVIIQNGKSHTVHLWQRYGNTYGDWIGNQYTL